MIEKNETNCLSETNSYYWLSFDELKNIISMNPYEHLELEQVRIEKNRCFLIYNKQCLCEHNGLHPMMARKGKYNQGNVYNDIKETFIKQKEI